MHTALYIASKYVIDIYIYTHTTNEVRPYYDQRMVNVIFDRCCLPRRIYEKLIIECCKT